MKAGTASLGKGTECRGYFARGFASRDAGPNPSLAESLARSMAAADLLARIHVARSMEKRSGSLPELSSAIHFAEAKPLPFESVPFTRAIDFIRNLSPVTRSIFDSLLPKYRAVSFTVARVADDRVIEQIRAEMEKTIAEGGTKIQFRRAVQANAASLAKAHINTVFRTNIQTAYMAGRFEQLTASDVVEVFPFWRYRTVGDAAVRPAHRAMEGFTARWDDPVWKTWYPPNGYNCRCTIESLMDEDVSRAERIPGDQRIPKDAADGPDPGFESSPFAALGDLAAGRI